MSFEIAADVGGTFTDIVVLQPGGRVRKYKAPTTQGQIVDGILNGLVIAADEMGTTLGILLSECGKFCCGTTVATNAILEGSFARTGLICTTGFRDTLLIREGGKQDTYNIATAYPDPFIQRHLIFGVGERINSEGGIEVALDEQDALEIIDRLKACKVESIAVALLWSIANPVHEQRIGELIEEHWPEIPYSLSYLTSPVLREYRRTSTTALDAALKPLVRHAVTGLELKLREKGFSGELAFVTSSGGQTRGEEVVKRPIDLCLSGPSAAPQSAKSSIQAEASQASNAIVVDMGGTSFDISIINDWEIPMHREGRIAGHIFTRPSVEVKTIGAGGGSIARVDVGGLVQVGPESAKSIPGPACYGRGGTLPTVTDANLVRGFLNTDRFADSTMTLVAENSRQAIQQHIASRCDLSLHEAASLIGLTVEQNMVGAIEDITIRQGVDPREYIMVAGGAAAGLHAVPIARELGIKRILVPPAAGVLCAYGILVSDIQSAFSRSLHTNSESFDFAGVNSIVRELELESSAYLDRMNVPEDAREVRAFVSACYDGQAWQLDLPLPALGIDGEATLRELVEAFHQLHEKLYFVRSDNRVEFTEWTFIAVGRLPEGRHDHGVTRNGPADITPISSREVFMRELGGIAEVPVYDFSNIVAGSEIPGPALIDQSLTTIVLYPSSSATVTEYGGLWIDLL